MTTLLTINTNVPGREEPGTPVLAFYDNGDWEIAFLGDTDYLKVNNPTYVGYQLVVDVLNAFNLDFPELDEADEDEDGILLYTQYEVTEGAFDEPVIVLYDDGEIDVYAREHAEQMVSDVAASGVFNFIPVVDFLDDLRTFRARNAEEMFDWRENDLTMTDPEAGEPDE